MSKPSNPFEAIAAQMQQQMQDMTKAMSDAVSDVGASMDAKAFEDLWPTMPKEAMDMWFGKGLNPEGLDAKTRLLLTLAGLTCQTAATGTAAEPAIRQTVRHALQAGATEQEISETIGLMGVFAGVPAMTKALEIARDVAAKVQGQNKENET